MSADSTPKRDKAAAEQPDADPADNTVDTADKAFPVVGIGASAGGLEAFLQLVKALPEDTGMGIVLIQHLDPNHESRLVELIAKVTDLPVDLAIDGMQVAPNHIYAIPPNTNMSIESGRLRMVPRTQTRGQHLPIDYFFRSLADDRHAMAVAVVLSGTGTDGTLGLAEIKAAGGLTFAQNAESAKYDGMPKSAAHSGAVDSILDPTEIARELGRVGHHPYLAPAKKTVEAKRPVDGEPFAKILRLLRSTCGVDFSQYRKSTIERRIMRRMVLHPQDTLADYARQLEGDRSELEALFEDILINVTSFFRDSDMFDALAEAVFPDILESKAAGMPIRIWTAGCSTGQEAYSLAIALTEFLEDKPGAPEIQIFATDLSDAVSLVKARAGHYPESIEAEVSPERLRRFFRKEAGGYRVVKAIRDLCVFAKQNIAVDPPFSRLDLISCRNVMIYLSGPLQKRIIPTFHYALNPDGFLLLGSSETIGGFSELFEPINKKHKVYAKKATAQRVYPHFSADRYMPRTSTGRNPDDSSPALSDWQKEADRLIVGRYAPAGVLVNNALDIIQFRGRTSPWLEPASGEASFNLLKMAREGLFGELRHSIAEAREKNEAVRRTGVRVRSNGHARRVDLNVIPVQLQGSPEPCFLVLFEEPRPPDGGAAESSDATGATPPAGSPLRRRLGRLLGGGREDPSRREPMEAERSASEPSAREFEQLRRELTATREHQQSILEQHEAANEELRSANEEVLSSNEELQSTNEELETAKEELQSLNEELTTVNEQLQNRNMELNGLNNDLSNFFGSTRIPLLMLGDDLRLRRFTPAAEKVFNLHSADIGRPLGDIRLSVDVPDLEAAALEVLDTMQQREKEIRDRQGRWHALRIRPYRTADNKIEGAVVALVDIDDLKRSEESLHAAATYAEAIIATVREPLVVLDAELRVRTANMSFYRTFQVTPEETERRLLYELGDRQWDIPQLRTLLEEVAVRDTAVEDFPVDHDFPAIGQKTMLVNARRLDELGDGEEMILVALEDITERRRLEHERAALLARERMANEELQSSEERHRHLVEALPAAVYTCDGEGRITLFNEAAVALWGRAPTIGEDLWCGSWKIYRPDGSGLPLDECPMAVAIKEGRAVRGEISIERPDGVRVNVIAHATPLLDSSGALVGATNLLTDITEQKRNEEAMARLAAIVEYSDDAIASKDLEGVIRSWNRGAERMFGYSAEEAVGRSIMLIVPEEREAEERKILETLRRGEHIVHFETVRAHKDGHLLDVSVTISPLRNAAGEVIGASKIARDITERKDHIKTLREADRHKDEFLAMLAHELRNPLSAVTSAVELLGTPDGAEHLQAARRIIGRQTRHLVRLVDDLLDMSRITRGTVSLHRMVLDFGVVIDGAVETVMPLIESRQHEMEVSVGDAPLWLEGDQTRLEQVVANLLTNAARYTEPGGHVQLSAERQGSTIVFAVRDNGIGISSDLLPSVFDLFSQSERAADRSSGGLGIGLTLVRSIVRMHGGTVEAHSGGPHRGSEFVVRLPALDDSEIRDFEVPGSPTPAIVNSTPARRVLLVDDNRDAALGLSALLEASGHAVEQSFDGITALAVAAASKPDAILLDIGLPGMDGYEVARRIRRNPELARVLLVAISGYCQDEDRERSRDAGFDYHLTKPVDHRRILTLLEEHSPASE